MNKKILSLVLAFAMILCSFSFVAAEGFTDVADDHYAREAIEYLVEREVVEGHGDGTFTPFSNVTRAQFAAMINRALDFTEKAEVEFTDVDEDAWYYDDVAIAVAKGYTEGHGGSGEGTFAPRSPITREQAATMISRALDLEESDVPINFTDAEDISDWAETHISATAGKGFVIGYEDGSFLPGRNINRGQSAMIIHRVLLVEEAIESAVDVAEKAIADLPALEDFDVEDEDDLDLVEDARALVDAALELDEDAVIEGLEDLEALEERIEELTEVTAIEEQLLALPDAEEVTAEDEEAIEAAREAYDALAEELAIEISEEALARLIGAEAALEALEEDEGETLPGEFERTPYDLNVIKFEMPEDETEITSVTVNGEATTDFNVDETEGRVIAEEATDIVIVIISEIEYTIVVD